MEESLKKQILKDEYLHIQKTIVDLDGRMVNIKTWSVTFSGASIAGAFIANTSAVLWVSFLSAIVFWYLEAHWKQFQYGFYGRSSEIEKYFRGENSNLNALQIDAHWSKNVAQYSHASIWKTMAKPHVALPHVFFVIFSVFIFVLATACIIKL